ncbi:MULTISPECIES: HD domain-containing phosphohydrolase [unclassified Pseudodesulfovibrio]|uniref:HD-GYP domain-containing protein n=1 Tax=unclassified Pseudodesulfovibrio TaxID=2661612 RepID=UPI000FEB6E16|nr:MULTISPECIES: HD domain-containing phosphohydrolase [unclassified Pseudodesulfovibrio]MCJ2165461.1 HD domain-containing protein [Pseudodesulfovibrio sp. S3-i]RWU03209.1 HD domain-containing protein [Pseudodesulfovibrio sp. S3]
MAPLKGQEDLLRIIRKISAGTYTDEIHHLTGPACSPEIQELAEAVSLMMVKIEAREERLEQLLEKIRRDTVNTVTSVVHALGARDSYTEGHGERVGVYARRLAQRLGLPSDEVERIRIAGTLHDIGKIGFSDRVFTCEDTPLSRDMIDEIHHHPEWGRDILKNLDFLGPALEYVYAHHELMDGSGYPRGLKGDEIPLGARILCVVDYFDAMTTDRPYQKGRPLSEAVDTLRSLAGSSLDPELVETFILEIETNGRIG